MPSKTVIKTMVGCLIVFLKNFIIQNSIFHQSLHPIFEEVFKLFFTISNIIYCYEKQFKISESRENTTTYRIVYQNSRMKK